MNEPAGVGHLSIGEVLSLVQQDFPDVTISKIRFLESQGLIAPERTASGYRKFYDSDIDRLRWILRQQRDHFLPLKVIRKMLDQGVDVAPADGQPTLWSAAATGPTGAGDAEPDAADATDAADGPEVRDAGGEGHGRTRRSPKHPAVASAPKGRPSPPVAAGGRDDDVEDDARPTYSTPADVVAALQEDPRTRGRGADRGRPADDEEPSDVAGSTDAGGAEATATPRRKPARSSRSARAARGARAEVRMTRSEICDAAGITVELLAGLEQYGLVVPAMLGGDPQYDADALEVARIAARYAELGVEPRHLRMYKVAAEREAGFVEQLVVPLLKQRNPTARQQAEERTDELQRMGAELHASLLRRRLGPQLGG